MVTNPPVLVPIFGFTFGAPWMLLFCCSAILPILIHLWTKRRYDREPWAAMSFLQEAIQSSRSRLQFRSWLHLLIRTLLLLLLGLALSDPTSIPDATEKTTNPQHLMFVLDDTYSMATGSEGITRLELAKRAAKTILSTNQQATTFSIHRFSPNDISPLISHASDADAFDAAMRRVSIQEEQATFEYVLRSVESTARAIADEVKQAQIRVLFFSDLQSNLWSQLDSESNQQALARLSKSCSLFVVPVGFPTGPIRNLVVTDMDIDAEFLVPGVMAKIRCEIQNFESAAASTTVQLSHRRLVLRFSNVKLGSPKFNHTCL